MEEIKKVVELLDEKKGEDIKIIDVEGISPITDYMIIASAETQKHARTMAENVKVKMKKDLGVNCEHLDGYDNGEWIIMDYFDFLVHIFLKNTREFYDIENLYRDSKEVAIND
ncbi:MAG: ribosome silencing factor [Candidatus Mcinerneyibacterium aminivorans]|jgi:ribosome-associated protein|uniref:Ribosomal silencing factor RsfS n=1 Tax=Candidatus Mcinerneyibacterium aminivorans TaxID=2703815 RepID=A0A5D0MEC4_9BACT|nr:MAG: ribosome silencing factor [Candidatus Mcinerneyibacterium aminivorans]